MFSGGEPIGYHDLAGSYHILAGVMTSLVGLFMIYVCGLPPALLTGILFSLQKTCSGAVSRLFWRIVLLGFVSSIVYVLLLFAVLFGLGLDQPEAVSLLAIGLAGAAAAAVCQLVIFSEHPTHWQHRAGGA